MIEQPQIIPLAVAVAVLIFIAKELLEGGRRFTANRRKLRAIRAMIARECELNNWTIDWFKRQTSEVRDALEEGCEITIRQTPTGKDRLVINSAGGEGSSQIPTPHTSSAEKYLLEVASLDARLFEQLQTMLTSAAELQHLRDQLIELTNESEQPWLGGWCDHADDELVEISATTRRLYRTCTGKSLEVRRLR